MQGVPGLAWWLMVASLRRASLKCSAILGVGSSGVRGSTVVRRPDEHSGPVFTQSHHVGYRQSVGGMAPLGDPEPPRDTSDLGSVPILEAKVPDA